jgi:hypothetical protein
MVRETTGDHRGSPAKAKSRNRPRIQRTTPRQRRFAAMKECHFLAVTTILEAAWILFVLYALP